MVHHDRLDPGFDLWAWEGERVQEFQCNQLSTKVNWARKALHGNLNVWCNFRELRVFLSVTTSKVIFLCCVQSDISVLCTTVLGGVILPCRCTVSTDVNCVVVDLLKKISWDTA